MRLPTFTRRTPADDTDTERTPAVPRRDEPTTTALPQVRPDTVAPPPDGRPAVPPRSGTEHTGTVSEPVSVPAAPGPRARASFVATLGLVLSVAGAMLVLTGPLLGYGVGVSTVALLLSLAGVFATRKRHVAGKTGALIGVLVSLATLVVGVLALTGQLWWLDTGTPTVTDFRTWLDTQFETWI